MFLKFNALAIIWATIVFFISVVAGSAQTSINVVGMDKFIHTGIYALLCLQLIVGFSKQHSFRLLKFNPVIGAVIVSATYGILLEFVQYFIPERSFDIYDMLANALGAFIGWLVFLVIYKL